MHYHYLLACDRMPLEPNPGSTSMLLSSGPGDPIIQTLYAGYFSLSKYWERCTTGAPIPLPRFSGCPEAFHPRCVSYFNGAWVDAVKRVELKGSKKVDVLAKLTNTQDILLEVGLLAPEYIRSRFSSLPIHSECAKIAQGHCHTIWQGLVSTMADHFFGPLPETSAPTTATTSD
jgi:hypothetical protein